VAHPKLLDELEPGVDRSGLKGKALMSAKKKHHIGPLKNKQHLINALQKTTGDWPGKLGRKCSKPPRKKRRRLFNIEDHWPG